MTNSGDRARLKGPGDSRRSHRGQLALGCFSRMRRTGSDGHSHYSINIVFSCTVAKWRSCNFVQRHRRTHDMLCWQISLDFQSCSQRASLPHGIAESFEQMSLCLDLLPVSPPPPSHVGSSHLAVFCDISSLDPCVKQFSVCLNFEPWTFLATTWHAFVVQDTGRAGATHGERWKAQTGCRSNNKATFKLD